MRKYNFILEGSHVKITASKMWAVIEIEGLEIHYNYIQFEIDEIIINCEHGLFTRYINLFHNKLMGFWNYDNHERLLQDIEKSGGIICNQ